MKMTSQLRYDAYNLFIKSFIYRSLFPFTLIVAS